MKNISLLARFQMMGATEFKALHMLNEYVRVSVVNAAMDGVAPEVRRRKNTHPEVRHALKHQSAKKTITQPITSYISLFFFVLDNCFVRTKRHAKVLRIFLVFIA